MGLDAIAVPTASELFARMAGRRVVVIGDVMIDEWIWGRVSRISPEAPVPVVSVNNHSFTLGGAGNVANNLRALGATVAFVGAVGQDAEAARARTRCDCHFMPHGVQRQRGVVRLDVQLEVRQQIEFPQEIQARRRVRIILVLRRFLRLGLDVELAFETQLLLVRHRQVQEPG